MSQAKFERYEAYKDSGVEWIGEVPVHWDVQRINNIARQQKIKNTGMRENNLLSLSYGRLKRKNIETTFGLLPESFETYQIVNKGNIILRLTDLQNDWTSLRVGLAKERGIITSAYLCLHFSKLVNPTFAYYLLYLYDLSKVFYWLGNGLRQTMRFEDIKVLPFVIPSVEEQQVIATYLDEKTAQIDRKIDLLSQKATQYGQLKQALINETVTRGLDKTVPLKDSGVEWLDEVPAHWEISRIKEKGSVNARVGWKALKASEYVDDGFAFLSTPNIKNKEIDFKNVNYITYERYVESPEIMLKQDDILLAKDGSTLGTVNIVTYLPRETTVNGSIAVLRFDKTIFNKYLFYQIKSEYIQDKIQLKKGGMGVPHLFQQDINNFIILISPLPEQTAIAAYLDEKTAHIDRIIATIHTQIDKLKELRKTLINDVVTGKIKVVTEGQTP